MADNNDTTDDDPLEELFGDEDDRPDEIEVREGVTIDTAEFHDRLEAVADAADALDTLADDAAALRRSGLYDDDVESLLYGRNSGLTKSTISAVMDALDGLTGTADREDLLVTLIADVSGESKADTRVVFEELRRLRSRYATGMGEDNGE
jgi:aspartate/tyrosine/aromatic aminotransferase